MLLRTIALMLVIGSGSCEPHLGMRYDATPPPSCVDDKLGNHTVSEHNACDSIVKTYPMYEPCCVKHRECYSKCGPTETKEGCDNEFRFCLQQTCGAGKRKFVRSRCNTGWSWFGPGMNSHRVAESSDFSCKEYAAKQAQSCHDSDPAEPSPISEE
ncbi:hypothetical protein K493DRAFT_377008 [Basidiobolus meristosporus CBS 931.73]|uniref:Uncharacterized protein n=1 Tax=Basidiobolus meristosporus CBS 931.73 TaxID=1314790 RepID=A0A1Y1WU43_9FUNG|nr:hypothetical protein K493DRAFT_308971 [Basidiobolus meristosporus CBS 931.73]ORY05108.1 hypothetical protein K493DRAFT_377008 [Basidiobolus meristosporus CBS 931.73]|eukprot:ORX76925.1 hypothetical protein K493DRAFT_308971 [Basidiobolus meristosporus CBS 931.73]